MYVLKDVCMLLLQKYNGNYNEKQITLISYLKSRISNGKGYFKSKYIAKDTGLTPKEVGSNMAILSRICPDFSIIRYSYSNCTTWLVIVLQ